MEMRGHPNSLSTHPQGQRQGPKCFLGRCKCPGAFSGLGAVELTALCSSSALGALGFPSRSTQTFSQGICLHRPPLDFPVEHSGILWERPVFSALLDLSASWLGIQGRSNLSVPVLWASRTQWKGKGWRKELVLEVSLTGCCLGGSLVVLASQEPLGPAAGALRE